MAVLNVKNFPDNLYEAIRDRAAADRRSVAQEVIHLLELALEGVEPLSILELRGLGRETWSEHPPSRHVAEERKGWD